MSKDSNADSSEEQAAIEAVQEEIKRKFSTEALFGRVSTELKPKAISLAAKLPFVREIVAGYYCMIDNKTPALIRTAIVMPLFYFVLPADAIPDLIPALGYTDDLSVWALAFKTFATHISTDHFKSADDLLKQSE